MGQIVDQHGYIQEDPSRQKADTSAPKMAIQPPIIWPWEVPWVSCSSCANTGSQNDLADALTLGWTADQNVKARWREQIKEQKLLGEDINRTVKYSEELELYDHSCYLHLLNCLAIGHELAPIFSCVVPSGEDSNGVSLSKHHEKQQKRNSTVGHDSKTKCCNWCHCREYVLPSEPSATEQWLPEKGQHANDAVEREHKQEQHHWSTPQSIQPYSVNLAATVPIPASLLAPPFLYCARFGMIPYNCCINWLPLYCQKKQDYLVCKQHGQGRQGRPPNCNLKC